MALSLAVTRVGDKFHQWLDCWLVSMQLNCNNTFVQCIAQVKHLSCSQAHTDTYWLLQVGP
jgi:hypothetical protein